MNSIFEEEDELLFPRSRVLLPPTMAQSPMTNRVLISPTGGFTVVEKKASGKRKRTVAEALERATGAGSPIWRTGREFPFTKPYAYALQGLTYALILVDPLDRLEGGLID